MSLTPGALSLLDRQSYLALFPLFSLHAVNPKPNISMAGNSSFTLHMQPGKSYQAALWSPLLFQGCSARSYSQQWAASTWFVSRSLWGINCPRSVSFMVFDKPIHDSAVSCKVLANQREHFYHRAVLFFFYYYLIFFTNLNCLMTSLHTPFPRTYL